MYFHPFLNKKIKNGPPIIAIIVDAGTSIGINNVRPSVSATKIIRAPSNAVNGINIRWS